MDSRSKRYKTVTRKTFVNASFKEVRTFLEANEDRFHASKGVSITFSKCRDIDLTILNPLIKIRSLMIHDCENFGLDLHNFNQLGPKLRSISIIRSSITIIAPRHPLIFARMKKMEIKYADSVVDLINLGRFPKLETLELRSETLQTLPSISHCEQALQTFIALAPLTGFTNFFHSAPQLHTISFIKTCFSAPSFENPRFITASLPSLHLFEIEHNKISFIPFHLHLPFPALVRLSLRNNGITTLKDCQFNVANLQILDLSENPLTSLKGLSHSIPSLSHLWLFKTKLENLVGMPFTHMMAFRGTGIRTLSGISRDLLLRIVLFHGRMCHLIDESRIVVFLSESFTLTPTGNRRLFKVVLRVSRHYLEIIDLFESLYEYYATTSQQLASILVRNFQSLSPEQISESLLRIGHEGIYTDLLILHSASRSHPLFLNFQQCILQITQRLELETHTKYNYRLLL